MVIIKKSKKKEGSEPPSPGVEAAVELRDKRFSRTTSVLSSSDGVCREEPEPTDLSDSSDSETESHYNGGECEKCSNPHDGKLLLQQQFSFSIDQVFTMIFTNCQFNVELRADRHLSSYEETPWQEQKGVKCRQIKYILPLNGPIGPKETQVTETQVMNKCSKPGALYSIDCTSDNAGVPYAEYFSVCVHYCLQQVTPSTTTLSLYGQIKFYKSTMFKSFIEKNSINGVIEFVQMLESKLSSDAAGGAPAARKSRGRRRLTATLSSEPAPPQPAPAAPRPRALPWLLLVVLLLLALNALLYWRLRDGGRPAGLDDLHARWLSLQTSQTAEWSILLERHSARQRDELTRWRAALQATDLQLAQTELALRQLLESIKPSLENAQREAEAHTRTGEL